MIDEMLEEPNMRVLIDCASEVCNAVGGEPLSDLDLSATVTDILFGTDHVWGALEQGLITREESVMVILHHLVTKIQYRSHVDVSVPLRWDPVALGNRIERSLFR